MAPNETVLLKARPGRWLPTQHEHIASWIRRLKARVAESPAELVRPIAELKDLVESNSAIQAQVDAMFTEALEQEKLTPLGQLEVRSFGEFLELLNAVMKMAPEAYQEAGSNQPAGLIGFPINALLDWPMATESGNAVFANTIINQQLNRVLSYWCEFLVSEGSRYVLTEGPHELDKGFYVVPWLGDQAREEMVNVARSALGEGANPTPQKFEQIFNCSPGDPYYGFSSWDDFFTRTFQAGVRPVSGTDDDGVIVNACEATPLQVKRQVALSSKFWLKGQPYSLADMLNYDDDAGKFDGGTIYQAFLSALSYHRWHSPVSGVIRKAYVVKGSYYLENLYEGFKNPSGADPSAPNDSQPFITAVATRALIFIEADNPKIGLMCVVPVGMSEVSSCQITVKPGQRVAKGDQLGMFHFGGSTHCLVFRPGVNLEFDFYGQDPGLKAANNLRVNTALASVS